MWPYLLNSAQPRRLNHISVHTSRGTSRDQSRLLYTNADALSVWREMGMRVTIIGDRIGPRAVRCFLSACRFQSDERSASRRSGCASLPSLTSVQSNTLFARIRLEGSMRSAQIYVAIAQGNSCFGICQLTSKGAHIMHKPRSSYGGFR
jgi:hypothetical protein